MSLAVGTRIGPYEILASIGAGGMGEVFRARDTRLGRDVAIKVLPAEYAADPDRLRRFEQEARATAALNHPNILAVFDIGTHEGQPYLVEELLEGESLRARLRGGALPVGKAVELAVQIAQGLAAAHEKGIVHRDLKPENLFLTKSGHLKILDFGLAKLARPDTAGRQVSEAPTHSGVTGEGHVLGTVGYMAPEQVRGLPCDHRVDVFALGCVLYEMVSGRQAFTGETQADTLSAILTKDPSPLSGPGKGVPPALQGIVSQCLEKRPEERFSSAHDLALALRAVSGESETPRPAPIGAPQRGRRVAVLTLAGVALLVVLGVLVGRHPALAPHSASTALVKIVVLPFENLGIPEDAYFAAGMADEITSRLASVHGLGVISRTTAVGYDRKGKTVKQIGADLGVDYVLEGAVRFDHGPGQPGRVRISPQLIRVADDTHVWADRYDRELRDVFAIQSDVAESAVRAMGVRLLPHEQTAVKEILTNDLEAYGLYLQGWELTNRGTNREFVEGALQKFQAAVDRDPGFVQAVAALASTHITMYWLHYDHSPERLARGKELAERAVEMRPDLAETHAALAQYYYHGLLDFPRALGELAIATRIQPSNSMVLFMKGLVLFRQGRPVEAAEVMAKGLEVDPRNPLLLAVSAGVFVEVRRYAEADRGFALASALSPEFAWARARRAELQIMWHGDVEKAQALLDEASRVPGVWESHSASWQWVALLRRDYPEVLRQIEKREPRVRQDPTEHSALLLSRGQAQALMGQGDLARLSYEAARVELEQLVRRSPDDTAFHALLGIAYAGLGRRADALREAKLAREQEAASRQRPAPFTLAKLAPLCTMVGQPGEAIAVLDELLSQTGSFTAHMVRLDPTWDPLRSDARFAALLHKHEVKE